MLIILSNILMLIFGIFIGLRLARDPRDSNGKYCKKKWYHKL